MVYAFTQCESGLDLKTYAGLFGFARHRSYDNSKHIPQLRNSNQASRAKLPKTPRAASKGRGGPLARSGGHDPQERPVQRGFDGAPTVV
eukprot:5136518-Pyramimonas_sp.AAC.1